MPKRGSFRACSGLLLPAPGSNEEQVVSKISVGLKGLCAVLAAASLSACGAHGQTGPNAIPQGKTREIRPQDTLGGIGGKSMLTVTLGDAAPALGGKQVDSINLGVLEIDAVKNGQVTVLASYSTPKIVDVLAHQDDAGEAVADSAVSSSSYDSLRVVVDIASSAVQVGPSWNLQTLPLNFLTNTSTASSVAAGVTTTTVADGPTAVDMVVTQPFSIPADQSQTVRLDFNAFESLALVGGTLLSRPALFVAPTGDLGVVRGHIQTSAGDAVKHAAVVAVASDGSIGNTGFTNANGNFVVGTLRSGTYRLMIYNTYTNATGAQFSATAPSPVNSQQILTGPSVTVTGGQTTYTDTIAD